MNKIILIGMGGHALSCLDIIIELDYDVLGFIDDKNIQNPYKINYLGNDNDLKKILKKENNYFGLIAFGNNKFINSRAELFSKLTKLGMKFTAIYPSSAYISKMSSIGIGTIIMHRTVINTQVNIGKNCIINTGSIIDHNSIIGDNCIVSTNVTINGNVKVSNNTFIGSGAIIFNDINIGKNCVISSGAVIRRDLTDNTIIK